MIEKLLNEIEDRLRMTSKLFEEKGQKYENLQINLWPEWEARGFKIQLWDGENHMYNPKARRHDFSPQELTQWLKEREILFQKFPNFSD